MPFRPGGRIHTGDPRRRASRRFRGGLRSVEEIRGGLRIGGPEWSRRGGRRQRGGDVTAVRQTTYRSTTCEPRRELPGDHRSIHSSGAGGSGSKAGLGSSNNPGGPRGAKAGGRCTSPKRSSRLRAAAASVTNARTVRRPPQAQCSRSSANTRLSNSAHGTRLARDTDGDGCDDSAGDGSEHVVAATSAGGGRRRRSRPRSAAPGPKMPK